MSNATNSSNSTDQGATVVISHRVRDGQQDKYNDWLNEISPLCRKSRGNLDLQIIRPITGLTATYTIVIRFDSTEHLSDWINSDVRKGLIEKVRPLLASDDDFFIRSGLDFWFTPEGARAKVPLRWKQFFLTWSAIYPLALGMPLAIVPVLRLVGLPSNNYLDTLFVTVAVVFLMVYVIMPRYTRLVQRWLFK